MLKFEMEAIGGEMEGGGLYAAAQRKKVDWILVKAICDWGDGHKKQDEGQRQKEAAENAARFTKYVIEKGGFGSPMLQQLQRDVAHNQSHVDDREQKSPVQRELIRLSDSDKDALVDSLLRCPILWYYNGIW